MFTGAKARDRVPARTYPAAPCRLISLPPEWPRAWQMAQRLPEKAKPCATPAARADWSITLA